MNYLIANVLQVNQSVVLKNVKSLNYILAIAQIEMYYTIQIQNWHHASVIRFPAHYHSCDSNRKLETDLL